MIREAREIDCNNLAALSLDVWLQTYAIDGINAKVSEYALATFTQHYFSQLLLNRKYKLLVFMDKDYLRGYALVNLESQYETEMEGFEIEKLYVHSAFQGQNVGKRLLQEIEKRYGNRFWLYTWTRNKSIGFYEHYGFKDIGKYTFEFGEDSIENRVFSYMAQGRS